jgi:N-acyl-D-amino-acid deacylase
VSGPDVVGVARFDAAVKAFMIRWNVPGATLAVAPGGKLVLVRGYGYADFEAGEAVVPGSRFRVGSISKVLTAAATLQLSDEGHLDLDAPFLDALPGYAIPAGGDGRLADVTLRQLLQHSGGWDRTRSPDYGQWQERIAADLGVVSPPDPGDMARWFLGRRLDFTPGQRFAYSNVGYVFLGRAIEAAGGASYEQRVREHLLAPIGIHAMTLGGGRAVDRQPGEVRYYDTQRFDSVYPGEGDVPAQYAWSLKSVDAAGAWVSTAADLTRLLTALDGSRVASPLTAGTWLEMRADPRLPNSGGGTTFGLGGLPGRWFYGLGLFVSADEPGAFWHGGSWMGTQAAMGRTGDGVVYAFLVNTRVEGESPQAAFTTELNALVPEAIAAGPFGSADDLYPLVPSDEPVAPIAQPSLP